MEADLPAEARRPPDDHSQHIARAGVARLNAVGDQKCGCAAVIGNDTIADIVGLALRLVVAQ